MHVIGAGRVGTSLHALAQQVGAPCTLVSRDEGWETLHSAPGAPIMVAVRNDDLAEVVPRVPAHRRDDLVFIQNGMIRPWLRDHALANCTRGLLFFAAKSRGGPIEVGADSPFSGPQALPTAQWLIDIGVRSIVVDWARFSALELEKLIWLATFGILCERYDMTVGEVADHRRGELVSLVQELSRVGRASMGVDMPLNWLVDRLCAYSVTISDYRASVKEWPWRNGWFVETAKVYRVSTPIHLELLRAIGKLEE